jgi:hypothetical protein
MKIPHDCYQPCPHVRASRESPFSRQGMQDHALHQVVCRRVAAAHCPRIGPKTRQTGEDLLAKRHAQRAAITQRSPIWLMALSIICGWRAAGR